MASMAMLNNQRVPLLTMVTFYGHVSLVEGVFKDHQQPGVFTEVVACLRNDESLKNNG